MREQIAGVENAGVENVGVQVVGVENAGVDQPYGKPNRYYTAIRPNVTSLKLSLDF